MYTTITKCRVCGNVQLDPLLSLGKQELTGVFPRTKTEPVSSGPLELVKCSDGATSCGLVQLKHSFDTRLIYGRSYGYRSGLNSAMVGHLRLIAKHSKKKVELSATDMVLDIGSNDGTLLSMFPSNCMRVGVDPLYSKFSQFYEKGIIAIPEFFSARLIHERCRGKRPKLVTSIAMFYDLEDPLGFASEIADVLSDDGVWVLEQSGIHEPRYGYSVRFKVP